MSNQPAPEIELLRAAYAAFNARDIDTIDDQRLSGDVACR
jgi:hypothetical protein